MHKIESRVRVREGRGFSLSAPVHFGNPVIHLFRKVTTFASSMAYKLPSLYAFSLPSDLLPHLQPRKLVIPPTHPLHPSNALPIPPTPLENTQKKQSDGAYVCALTGASFSDVIGLKEHYKTDWYKYNVKLKLQGKTTPVGEEEFNHLVESTLFENNNSSLSFFLSTHLITQLFSYRSIRFYLWFRIHLDPFRSRRRTLPLLLYRITQRTLPFTFETIPLPPKPSIRRRRIGSFDWTPYCLVMV